MHDVIDIKKYVRVRFKYPRLSVSLLDQVQLLFFFCIPVLDKRYVTVFTQ